MDTWQPRKRNKEVMAMEAMNNPLVRYLQDARAAVSRGEATRFALGNEAADLDSMASALALGYFATATATATATVPGTPVVPLVNVPRADYKLRTEAVFLFSSLGIEPDLLTFIDEVDLDALHAAGDLELLLVDHNVLAAAQGALADAVVGVVDHHQDEGGFADVAVRIVEPVGSAATLVAELLLRASAPAIEAPLAELLLGTILLDTVNLDPAAKRATARDAEIAARLLTICGADREALFERLQLEKFNVSALDTADLLRKDYKEYQLGPVRCGIASVLLPIAQWLDKDPALVDSLAAFAGARKLDLLLAMNAFTEPEFRRELVTWTADASLRDRVNAFLAASDLGLRPIDDARAAKSAAVALYSQANAAYSRKKLQPLLQEFLA
jgi:exopolyphosphatase